MKQRRTKHRPLSERMSALAPNEMVTLQVNVDRFLLMDQPYKTDQELAVFLDLLSWQPSDPMWPDRGGPCPICNGTGQLKDSRAHAGISGCTNCQGKGTMVVKFVGEKVTEFFAKTLELREGLYERNPELREHDRLPR